MPRIRKSDQVTKAQMKVFGEWLRDIRESKKATQDEFAQFLNLSNSYYNALENGRRTTSRFRLYEIAKRLGDLRIIEKLFGSEALTELQFREQEYADKKPSLMYPLISYWDSEAEETERETVSASSLFLWWGYPLDTQVEIRRVSGETLIHGQLVYARLRAPEEKREREPDEFFAVVDLSAPYKPLLRSLENILVEFFQLHSLAELERWGLESNGYVTLLTPNRWNLYEVERMVVPIGSQPLSHPWALPPLQECSPEVRKHVAEESFFLRDLEKRTPASEPVLFSP
ncbi:helix-turn-helix domain-containing protein [Alicyclobacillus sendaiensis]|uniref:helix-turn-helix domain-containing protein n=1 Tax=Alicyclobacillus sendaiensis TaxID=192387 RepID=UPI0026F41598|nr:helix-turn-helix transcriptional regulator [Alicyclobacillus sendaiensis]